MRRLPSLSFARPSPSFSAPPLPLSRTYTPSTLSAPSIALARPYATRTKRPQSKEGRENYAMPPELVISAYDKWRAEGRKMHEALFYDFLNQAVKNAPSMPEYADFALRVLQDINAEGIKPLPYAYTMAIQACALAKQTSKALQVPDRMATDGVEPDFMVYMALVRACAIAQPEQKDKALGYWEKMLTLPSLPEERDMPFESVYNALKGL